MKITVATIFAIAGATVVTAADFPDNMPDCGRVCGTNMLGKAAEFNCPENDIACLCRDARFGYGVHDCSVESCPAVDQANIVIGWGNNLCSNAGAPANIPTATALGAGEAVGSPVTTEVVTTVTSGDSTITTTLVTTISDSDDDVSAVATSTWTSVVTSGDATTTITGVTTLSGISGVAGATSIPQTTITTPIVSTQTDESSTFEITIGSSTIVSSITGDALSSALSSQASEAASTESDSGAQPTAAPVLGFFAAAGLAAVFL